MKKTKKRNPVLPTEHTPEELQLREYADKINPLAELIKKKQTHKDKKFPDNHGRKLRDVRLPLPGSVLEKDYKGKRLTVKVLEVGFEYESKYYKTLSGEPWLLQASILAGIISSGYERDYQAYALCRLYPQIH